MMEDKGNILFSERFQNIYEWLGVFSLMYMGSGSQGIDGKRFIEETNLYGTGTEQIVSILTRNNLIVEKDGKLHLNSRLFFNMSIWDLLVICEPWLDDKTAALEASRLERITGSENLSRTYTQIYP